MPRNGAVTNNTFFSDKLNELGRKKGVAFDAWVSSGRRQNVIHQEETVLVHVSSPALPCSVLTGLETCYIKKCTHVYVCGTAAAAAGGATHLHYTEIFDLSLLSSIMCFVAV